MNGSSPQSPSAHSSGSGGPSISRLSIRRHVGVLMVALAVIVLGWFYVSALPVNLLPSITYPRIGVRLDAPGFSPEVAVDEITRPLEEALSATEGVVQVFSSTREGRVRVDLYFDPGGDIDQALNDATAVLNRTRDRLPDTVEPPRLFKFDPSQLPVYEFALTSSQKSAMELRVFADEDLSRELGIVSGVASVDVSGGVEEEIRVDVDLERLQALGVNLTDVLNDLDDRNQDISGGRIQGDEGEVLTRTVGRFAQVQEIRDLAFATPNQGRVYLGDFAQVIDGPAEERVLVRLNGSPAVKLSIQKQPEANTIEVVDGVKQRLQTLRAAGLLTEDLILTSTLDESRFIRQSIQNVALAGLSGAALAGVAVFVFLGSLRQTLIVVLAIPLATLFAIILMGVFDLSLNIFSLGGLAVGVGIVVDNAIVMIETISAGVEGVPSGDKQAVIRQAERSSQELESALFASTSTNLVAVLPFLLVGGFFSLLFSELILSISFAVAASLVVALTVVPMLASRLLAIPISSGLSRRGPLRWFNQGFRAGTRAYQGALAQVLRLPWLVIVVATLILGGGSYWMVDQIPQQVLPRIDTGQARLFASFPPGTPLADNQRVMEAVDQILLDQPETDYAFTTIGGFLFASSTIDNPLRSSSTITLQPGTDVATYSDRVSGLFNQLNLVGIRLRLSPDSVRGLITSNSPVRADLDVILQGNDSAVLEQAGQQVLQALDQGVDLARFRPDGDDRQPEVQIRPDWERAFDAGLTTQDIGNTIETAIQGSVATLLQREDRLLDVRVQLADGNIDQMSELEDLPLFTASARPIRVGDVAQVGLGLAPSEIQRINQRQVYIIEGTLTEEATISGALAQVEQVFADLDLPAGVSRLPSSAAESNDELQNALITLGALAAFLVFVVMAVQYNSLIDPLVILFTVPFALAGGILGLYVTQTSLGAPVLVGAILLVGIVVNNAIIMVEQANQLRRQQGLSYRGAILAAAGQRLRPILMTTITTVLGLFPLALGIGEGSELLQPLGVVVFSGLSLATLLTLFMIPCFYVVLHGSGDAQLPDLPPLGAGQADRKTARSGRVMTLPRQ